MNHALPNWGMWMLEQWEKFLQYKVLFNFFLVMLQWLNCSFQWKWKMHVQVQQPCIYIFIKYTKFKTFPPYIWRRRNTVSLVKGHQVQRQTHGHCTCSLKRNPESVPEKKNHTKNPPISNTRLAGTWNNIGFCSKSAHAHQTAPVTT